MAVCKKILDLTDGDFKNTRYRINEMIHFPGLCFIEWMVGREIIVDVLGLFLLPAPFLQIVGKNVAELKGTTFFFGSDVHNAENIRASVFLTIGKHGLNGIMIGSRRVGNA